VGFVAEAIALTDAGRFCYRWLFPAILNLKLKPVRELLLLATFTSSQPKGTTKSIVQFANFEASFLLWSPQERSADSGFSCSFAQSLFLQIVDVHFETDETNQRPIS
jgi:hypothetical protein